MIELILYSYYGYYLYIRRQGADEVSAKLFACLPTVYYLSWLGVGINRMIENACRAADLHGFYGLHANSLQWFIITIGIPSILVGTLLPFSKIDRAAEIYTHYRSTKYYKVASVEAFFLLLLPVSIFAMWDSIFFLGVTLLAHGCFMFFGGRYLLWSLRKQSKGSGLAS